MGKEFASAPVVGPRQFSMILIIIGIVALVLATLQHRHQVKILKLAYPNIPASTAGVVAGLISFLGLLAVLAVIFRL